MTILDIPPTWSLRIDFAAQDMWTSGTEHLRANSQDLKRVGIRINWNSFTI